MNANFRGKGASPTHDFWHQKSRVPELSYGEKKLPKSLTAWVGCTNVTDDRQTTDRQTTDGRPIAYSKRNVIRWRLLKTECKRKWTGITSRQYDRQRFRLRDVTSRGLLQLFPVEHVNNASPVSRFVNAFCVWRSTYQHSGTRLYSLLSLYSVFSLCT